MAVKVYKDYAASAGDDSVCVIASTASPFKFCRSVLEAIDPSLAEGEEFEMVDVLSRTTGTECPPQLAGLADKPVRFTDVRSKEDMRSAVYQMLGVSEK